MTTFTVTTECGTHRTFGSRREAEEGKETHESLCEECEAEGVRIEAVPEPPDAVPSSTITEGDGQPTMDKRGDAVVAHHFDIVVGSEAITTVGETDHEYAEFEATA